jgi:hypothetical protein
MPDNVDCLQNRTEFLSGVCNSQLVGTYFSRKLADCAPWRPEPPRTIGLYHAYVRSFNQDGRSHRLYIVTSGGCNSIADSYYNLFMDVKHKMTVDNLFNSEETWYLRNVCERNNNKLIHGVAKLFDLDIATKMDMHDFVAAETACVTTETMVSDLVAGQYNKVSLLNNVSDTSNSKNGIIYPMHPSEGVWIFKGPPSTSSSLKSFGGSFGNTLPYTMFPNGTYTVNPLYNWNGISVHGSNVGKGVTTFVNTCGSSPIRFLDADGNILLNNVQKYTFVDESHIDNLQKDCCWDRSNGIVELMPIAVVHHPYRN